MVRSNEEAWRAAKENFPGGVNSPVRAFRAVRLPEEEEAVPVFAARGKGAYLTDASGKRYIDFLGSWGPLILGHAAPRVVRAVRAAAGLGLSFGMPTEAETRLGEAVRARFPSIERIRFVSTGTEATMSALRLARGATGRDKILKFEGGYHGHADYLLVKAGSGAATLGTSDSAGVPEAFARETLVAPYNDLEAVRSLARAHAGDLAAVIVEPVAGNMGVVPPAPGFLRGLREITREIGALLIYDEVITGFRLSAGGAQGISEAPFDGVTPDLTCLGKILGGGLAVGAYGGRADLMNRISPEGDVYQAGTLSGNPVAMAAGLATLESLTPDVYARIDSLASRLGEGLAEAAARAKIPLVLARVGSMWTPFFTEGSVANYAEAARSDREAYARYQRGMLSAGIYLPPSALEAAFVSAAHGEREIERALRAARRVFKEMARKRRKA